LKKPVAPTLEASVEAFNLHMQRVWAMIGHPSKVLRLSDYIDPKAAKPAVQSLAEVAANIIESAPVVSKS
jgi:hypothetical protein